MDDVSDRVAENMKATIKKLSDLFQKECLKTQNEYLDEISSWTGKYRTVIISTVIKTPRITNISNIIVIIKKDKLNFNIG